MNSLFAFSADASYLSVFTENTDNPAEHIAQVCAPATLCLFFLCLILSPWSVRAKTRVVWKTLIVLTGISLVSFIISAVIARIVIDEHAPIFKTQVEHMDANLKHKYNADLADTFTGYDNDYLTGDNAYMLSFPDGQKGTYTIKWDKTTSEPTIIEKDELPSAHELNQNANKH